MTRSRSRTFAGLGLLSLAAQLVVTQAMAFAGTPAPVPTPSPTASSSMAPSTAPSPSPPAATSSPSPTADPQPSPVASEPAEPPKRNPRPRQVTPQSAQAGFSAGADPIAISLGDTSTITALVSNDGDAELKNATVTFRLPYQLQLASLPSEANESVSGSGTTTVTFSDLDVAVAETKTLTFEVLGAQGTGTTAAQVVAELVTGSGSLATRFSIQVTGPGLKLKTYSNRRNVEVGGSLQYFVEVTSAGTDPLTDLVVTNHIPAQLESVWVELVEGITYRKIGSDLEWSVDTLPAGETLAFRWKGQVVDTGPQYLARNVVEATAASLATVTAEATTRLLIPAGQAPVDPNPPNDGANPPNDTVNPRDGASGSAGPSGPAAQGSVATPDVQGAVGAGPSSDPLPFTGSDPRTTLMTSLILMAAGTLLLWGGRDRIVAPASDLIDGSLLPWVTLIPDGRALWDLVEDLKTQVYGG